MVVTVQELSNSVVKEDIVTEQDVTDVEEIVISLANVTYKIPPIGISFYGVTDIVYETPDSQVT